MQLRFFYSVSFFSTCSICNNLCTIGAKKTAVMLRNATPLYKAKSDEKILALADFISTTGPIPVKIMHAI